MADQSYLQSAHRSPNKPLKKLSLAVTVMNHDESLQHQALDDKLIQNQREIEKINSELENAILCLNGKISQQLQKNEDNYLNGYKVYVKQKEQDLRQIVNDFIQQNKEQKDQIELIQQFKLTIKKLNEDCVRYEKENLELRESCKYWKQRCEVLQHDNQFMEDQVIDGKKKQKILKIAVLTVKNSQLRETTSVTEQLQMKEKNTFITSLNTAKGQTRNLQRPATIIHSARIFNNKTDGVQKSQQSSMELTNPTQLNLKCNENFENIFEDIIGKSIESTETKAQIIKFVNKIESYYQEIVEHSRKKIDQLKLNQRKVLLQQNKANLQRSELETLFLECVEEVKKNICRRKDQNARDDSVYQLLKSGLRLTEFTSQDRVQLLEMVVNNEKTLSQLNQILFPNQSQNILKNSKLSGLDTIKLDSSEFVQQSLQQKRTSFQVVPSLALTSTQPNSNSLTFRSNKATQQLGLISKIASSNLIQSRETFSGASSVGGQISNAIPVMQRNQISNLQNLGRESNKTKTKYLPTI